MDEAHQPTVANLRRELRLRERELDLIRVINRVRDAADEPSAMLTGLTTVLADVFEAPLSLLCLLDRDDGGMALKAVNDRGDWFERLGSDVLHELAERAIAGESVIVEGGDGFLAQSDGIQLATVPISGPRGQRLGAAILIREKRPFGAQDVYLLRIARDQIGSVLTQAYAYRDLRQRNRELETIYRVDRIRDQQQSFDRMLDGVLHELRAVVQAEAAFVMLYDRLEGELEVRATTSDDLFRVSPRSRVVRQIADQALKEGRIVCRNDLSDPLRSALCLPLNLNGEMLGVLGVVNRYRSRGFDADDRRLLTAIASQMDTAIFESRERRRLRRVLGRSVDPRVLERLLSDAEIGFLEGERSVLSVLYADMRGSTSLAERTAPELLVGFVNDYLGRMTDTILAHQGTLDKFVGDGVMALFGAPFPQPDHALRAVRVGLAMQEAHEEVMGIWRRRGIDPTPIGVGVSTGELTVGEIGCSKRTDYTAIGRAANLGARLCSVAPPGQVLISRATYELIGGGVEAVPVTGLSLRGVGEDVTAYQVLSVD